jgi:phosphoserine aminotransferase
MTQRVYNFTAGPAILPLPVMKRIHEEFFDFEGLGASVIEISHRSPEFEKLLFETEDLVKELLALPKNYKVIFCHGGGQMQFSMVPLNLMGLRPGRKAQFVESGNFSERAIEEAQRYGTCDIVATSRATQYDRIPAFDPRRVDPAASYFHITTNNTIMGTAWHDFPDTDGVPLVGDMTSEIMSRVVDYSKFGMVYAGAQKNLAPAGFALVVIREELLGHADPLTPKLLNYTQLAKDRSLTNTVNTFSIYVARLVLEWLKNLGGVAAVEAINRRKAARVYRALDAGKGFYRPHAQPDSRSLMNVTFTLPSDALLKRFLAEGLARGLYGLKGHARLGGVRASIYNGMPEEGCEALAGFMEEFARKNG